MPSPSKILVVEDESSIRELYLHKLHTAGFETDSAQDGIQGLKKAEEFLPDLILLDLKMPEMNGDEMLQRLREQEWGAEMRVIILTNISRDEAPTVLRFLNVAQYMVKAHNTPSQIVEVVRRVLAS